MNVLATIATIASDKSKEKRKDALDDKECA